MEKLSKSKNIDRTRLQIPINTKKRRRHEFEAREELEETESNANCSQSTQPTKQRKINLKSELLWLKVDKSKPMRKPFRLYNDRAIFNCKSKEIGKMLEQNLIEHKQDDDVDSEAEIVEKHIEMCKDELKTRIQEFLDGDALKLCRNIRNEFSGIEKIECKEEEDINSSPDSSWYEIVSIPTVK